MGKPPRDPLILTPTAASLPWPRSSLVGLALDLAGRCGCPVGAGSSRSRGGRAANLLDAVPISSIPCGVGGVCCAALDRQRREETSTPM
jgi:hypothetical protein